mgnify:CR=1 FL=1
MSYWLTICVKFLPNLVLVVKNKPILITLIRIFLKNNLHKWSYNQCVYSKNGDTKVPNKAECTVTVDKIPLDILATLLVLRLLLKLFVDLINHVVSQQLFQFLFLSWSLSYLFIVSPCDFPKVFNSSLRNRDFFLWWGTSWSIFFLISIFVLPIGISEAAEEHGPGIYLVIVVPRIIVTISFDWKSMFVPFGWRLIRIFLNRSLWSCFCRSTAGLASFLGIAPSSPPPIWACGSLVTTLSMDAWFGLIRIRCIALKLEIHLMWHRLLKLKINKLIYSNL